MKTNNTIAGCHVLRDEDGLWKVRTSKLYSWNIPKVLRQDPIQPGDIVEVATSRGRKPVLVMDVFREEFEETQRRYKKVLKVLERAPEEE
ncbi:hypothetical protein AAV35_013890 (plasmid) [Salimicrobium jeotgali]|uniref:Uncharacterized protein n=1 Tax=Salimicrobium jeotgali TaxID=1230341 RepID=K2H4P6_9BACI|nr:DUF5839 family protein [Salimicrobium jeotgali]AKG05863.1 hypothetical protein AAV35_013890 [Salimicrobium jeotgali]EKE30850.1 hypothetical protein MJ3_11410 [Salimicrobium jeotgali]MBM7697440.1 hypothetical protein [Salimicrobium jeotgali]